ncbi:N(G),N(G)-dimethylarginine dimethylaminohydrolase [bacterium MnTg04]|nr:N(G),N(G)-dimethylarginine dimethylaminohydrolase [bacterium MnTg04]
MELSVHNEWGAIDTLLMRHPREAFASQARIDRQWQALNYHAAPNFKAACREFDALLELLAPRVNKIELLPADGGSIDSLYLRDSSVVCDEGSILCRMGKQSRAGEPPAVASWLSENGHAVAGRIIDDGLLEGGDLIWLDERTVAIGQGYRSNSQGLEQFSRFAGNDVDVIAAPLPHWNGPTEVLHLMSVISPLDKDLALVHSPLMPVVFREYLLSRDIRLLEVPAAEYPELACNVLAIGPRLCLMVSGNTQTRVLLEQAGCEVLVFSGDDICRKGEGGPTCLTRPLRRAATR